MAHQPNDAATTRQLLAALATPPPEDLTHTWAQQLRDTVYTIRAFLLDAESSATATVPFTVLHQWRTILDTPLTAMRQANAELWQHHRQPGTWLDALLRLRSITAHVLAKAGVPPTFRTRDPIRSLPERRGINARTAQKVHA